MQQAYFSREYLFFDTIDSTHAYAVENSNKLKNGTIISANFQNKGRGRLQRSWISDKGDSLLISILLKPKISPDKASLITPILSIAVSRLLDQMNIKSEIVWPNDIMVKGKKIGGILADTSIENSTAYPSYIVASLGLNVNQDKDKIDKINAARPATSIYLETSKKHDPTTLINPLIDIFEPLYTTFLTNGFAALIDEWRDKMSLFGEDVLIDLGKKVIGGTITKFGDDGSIEITESNGQNHFFHSGEIIRIRQNKKDQNVI